MKRVLPGSMMMKISCVGLLGIMIACYAVNRKDIEKNIENRQPESKTVAGKDSSDDSTVGQAFLMGKFDPSVHPDFVEIQSEHADREGMYLQREVYDAFKSMYDAALEDSVELQIRSATRNFDYQKGIWERKWTGMTLLEDQVNALETYSEPVERARQILRYSAMPGSSRHHWGTEVDLNAFNNDWFAAGEGLKLYEWMKANAGKYGFCQPFTEKSISGRTGYEEEKWHWSYETLATKYLKQAEAILEDGDIQGFLGSEISTELQIVDRYISGIAEECR